MHYFAIGYICPGRYGEYKVDCRAGDSPLDSETERKAISFFTDGSKLNLPEAGQWLSVTAVVKDADANSVTIILTALQNLGNMTIGRVKLLPAMLPLSI
jgi:hypothetical protein